MRGCVATELIEEWQNQLQGVPPVSRPSPEHGEVVIIGRQRVTHWGLEFVNSKRETLSCHVSREFLKPVFVCYFNDDVDSLAHRVGLDCFVRSTMSVQLRARRCCMIERLPAAQQLAHHFIPSHC